MQSIGGGTGQEGMRKIMINDRSSLDYPFRILMNQPIRLNGLGKRPDILCDDHLCPVYKPDNYCELTVSSSER